LKVFHLSKSVGKKQAIEIASQVAKGEIYSFMVVGIRLPYLS
jgi:hypothetical protein